MKRLMIIAAVFAALAAGCDSDGSVSTPPVERIRITTVSSDGKTEAETDSLTMKGEVGLRKYLRYEIVPADAVWGAVWTSSDPAKAYYDHVSFQVVALETGQVTLTAASVGKTRDGGHAVAACALDITVVDPSKLIQWTFDRNPEGWTEGSAAAQPTDADYGNGMTLLGTTRTMGIYPARTLGDFSKGALRIGGSGTVARITGISGPYNISVHYQSGGTATDDHRYPVIEIGSVSFNANHELSSSFGGGGKILEAQYTGTGGADIVLKAVNGIYIYDVIIEPKN
jgi:hypothetical protein